MPEYEEPSLQKLKSSKWQISVKFLAEIRKYPSHRKRVYTETTDKKLVEKPKHKIGADIYAEFDKNIDNRLMISVAPNGYLKKISLGSVTDKLLY